MDIRLIDKFGCVWMTMYIEPTAITTPRVIYDSEFDKMFVLKEVNAGMDYWEQEHYTL